VHSTFSLSEATWVVASLLCPGDYVLIKASRSVGLEALVSALLEEAA